MSDIELVNDAINTLQRIINSSASKAHTSDDFFFVQSTGLITHLSLVQADLIQYAESEQPTEDTTVYYDPTDVFVKLSDYAWFEGEALNQWESCLREQGTSVHTSDPLIKEGLIRGYERLCSKWDRNTEMLSMLREDYPCIYTLLENRLDKEVKE